MNPGFSCTAPTTSSHTHSHHEALCIKRKLLRPEVASTGPLKHQHEHGRCLFGQVPFSWQQTPDCPLELVFSGLGELLLLRESLLGQISREPSAKARERFRGTLDAHKIMGYSQLCQLHLMSGLEPTKA